MPENKFKPQHILDEQIYMGDAQNSLLYQLREEAKETNRLLRKLVKQNEQPTEDSEPAKDKSKEKEGK